jgi:hypothetical protein
MIVLDNLVCIPTRLFSTVKIFFIKVVNNQNATEAKNGPGYWSMGHFLASIKGQSYNKIERF